MIIAGDEAYTEEEWQKLEAQRARCRAYYQRNKDRIQAYQKQWMKDNAEYIREYYRDRYAKNKVKIDERNRRWRERNSDYMKQYHREYYQRNRERELERARIYRQKLKGATENV